MSVKKLLQCVPNFSEGRDKDKIEKIVDCFRGKEGVKLLDYSSDEDHNRSVVTLVGEPAPLQAAVVAAMGVAAELIDMTKHEGQHPRMGATDVVPFIPVKNATTEDAIEAAVATAKEASEKFNLPIFLYEDAATCADRKNLATVRKGQYEGMAEKLQDPTWKPDFGPTTVGTAGVTAVGARMPLVAFNVNLGTDNLEIADKIAKSVRHIGGGLRYCKGMGVALEERGIVQVSMNMTNYQKTPLYRVVELIRAEAKRWGVPIVGSELIGLCPMEALTMCAEYYMGIEAFSMEQVLETHLME
ncbi:MAG: glutamate formimidoyltransferase [Clostridia bacterium]|nr:glutamate formimidoyltransferase [Clostridia bacterium]